MRETSREEKKVIQHWTLLHKLKSAETYLDCRKVHKDEIETVISALQRNNLSREYHIFLASKLHESEGG